MIQGSGKRFAGIDIPVGLTYTNFFNLYLASWIMGCLMALPTVIQPTFLKETIGIPEGLAGSINSGLQNMSQLATLVLIGVVGVASDKYGRRILVIVGFMLCFIFYIVFGHSRDIALALGIILFLQTCGYLFDNISCQSPFLLKGAVDLLFGIWVWTVRVRIMVASPGRENSVGI